MLFHHGTSDAASSSTVNCKMQTEWLCLWLHSKMTQSANGTVSYTRVKERRRHNDGSTSLAWQLKLFWFCKARCHSLYHNSVIIISGMQNVNNRQNQMLTTGINTNPDIFHHQYRHKMKKNNKIHELLFTETKPQNCKQRCQCLQVVLSAPTLT